MRLLIALMLFAAPAPASAQMVEDREAQARTLAREGAAAFRIERYNVALAKFQAANALVPHPNLQVNIGRSFEKLDQLEAALTWCRKALAATAIPKATEAAAQACVERISPKLAAPVLEVRTLPAGASVMVDGQPKGLSPWKGEVRPGTRQVDVTLEGHRAVSRQVVVARGKPAMTRVVLVPEAVGAVLALRTEPPDAQLTLDGEIIGRSPLEGLGVAPGRYILEVRKGGYRPVTMALPAADGELVERDITLVPEAGDPRSHRPQWPAWLMMGSGVVAAGVGGYFGVLAVNDRQDADQLARTSTLPEDRLRYDAFVSDMEGNRTLADVLVTSGSVLIIGGLTWLLWPDG